jgi:hypothetical protein
MRCIADKAIALSATRFSGQSRFRVGSSFSQSPWR